MVRIMHGSVSQASVDVLAAEYIVFLRNGGNIAGTHEYQVCRNIINILFRRLPYDAVVKLIKEAGEAYDLLTPESPA